MFASDTDVVVLGAGPAGLAIASACAMRGLRVACVAPSPEAAWQRSFGVWGCEVAGMGPAIHVERAWAAPTVCLDAEPFRLASGYARVDVARTQRAMLDACVAHGVTFSTGAATHVEHRGCRAEVHVDDGRRLRGGLVIDATGPRSSFVLREPPSAAPAYQTAWGELVELGASSAPVEMSLMDFRSAGGGAHDTLPTFLYALPLGGRVAFVEETVLAGRPVADLGELRARLHARLAAMDVHVVRVLDREACVIPLGAPLPRPRERVVAFGAAAGLVHPATGYQLARTLALAPVVADAIATASDPLSASLRAQQAIWPTAMRRAWAFYRFGMEAICSFDRARLVRFLRAFFDLPGETWLGFLRGTLSPTGIVLAMGRVMARAEPDVRAALLRLLATRHDLLTRPFFSLEEPA